MRGAKTGKGKGEDDQREQGFNQYFSGANKDRAQEKDKDLRVRNKSKQGAISKERKGWVPKPLEQPVQSVVIKAVNKRYSEMDEEEEDTGNKWKKPKQRDTTDHHLHHRPNKPDEQSLAKYTLNLEKQRIELQAFNETRDLGNVDLSNSVNHFSELKETLSGLEMNQDVQESLRKSMHLWGKLGEQGNRVEASNEGQSNPESILEIIQQNKDDALFMQQIDAFVRDLCKKRDPFRDNIQSAKTLKPEIRIENQEHREFELKDGLSKKPFQVGKGSLRIDSAKTLKPRLENADDRPLPTHNRQGKPSKADPILETANEPILNKDKPEHEDLHLDFDSSEKQPLKQSIPKASPVKVVAKKELAAQLISDLRDTVPVKTKPSDSMEQRGEGTPQMTDKLGTRLTDQKLKEIGNMDSLFLLPEENETQQRKPVDSIDKQNMNKETRMTDEKVMGQITTKKANEKPSKLSFNVSDSLFESKMGGSPSDPTLRFENHIIIRIKSSHGGAGKEAGLTSIRLFDKRGEEIALERENLVMRGCKKEELAKLLTKNAFTTDPSQMWKTEFPFLAGHMDLEIKYFGLDPGYLRVWNYNADKSIGCRNIEIIVNSLRSIDCNLKPGSVQTGQDYHQDLQLAVDALEPPAVELPIKKPLTSSQNFNDLFNCENEPKLDESLGGKGKVRKNMAKNNVQINFKKMADSGYIQGDKIGNLPQQLQDNPKIQIPTTNENSRRARDLNPNFNQKQEERSEDSTNLGKEPELRKPEGKVKPTQKYNVAESQILDLDESNFIEKPTPLVKPDKNGQPSKKPERQMDALDEIDFKINNLRDFDRNNLGRIELSQMDLPTKVLADPPEMFIYKNFSEVLNDNQYFCVPELPKGTVLEFELFSTWGDKYYIGLSGIEVFDHKGLVVPIDGNRVSARPSDLNSLPEYKGDPRTPDKLVDGEYLTCDENHSWLAPFYEGKVNRITIDLGRKTSISMIRVWNYNKNRIHSARGARELLIKIDGMLMFFGVVSQAPGDLARGAEQAEYILFTTNKSVLETIEKNDWLNSEPEDGGAMNLHLERPSTSSLMENKFQTTNNEDIKDIRKQIEMNKRKLESLEKEKKEKSKRQAEYSRPTTQFIECQKLSLRLVENWGMEGRIGLTSLEFFDDNSCLIKLKEDMISTNADDGADSLGRLINGVNITSNALQMWQVGFNKSAPPFIYINFGEKQRISGFKLWNYNKSLEDSFSGVRKLEIIADLHKVTHDFIFIKKAPTRNISDYSQFIHLPAQKSKELSKDTTPERSCLKQYWLPPRLPTGYSLRLRLLSTWGDSSYLGLNGIEIFDKKGKPLFSQPHLQFEIHSDPEDVSILTGMERDVRKVTNLLDGVNLSNQDRNIWLAPYINPHMEGASNLGREANQLFIDFKEPISIACIKFYNYSKNSERGVRSFEAYLDDYCIFSGELRPASVSIESDIIFTSSQSLIEKMQCKPVVGSEVQHVEYNNEGQRNGGDKRLKLVWENLERPQTGLNNY